MMKTNFFGFFVATMAIIMLFGGAAAAFAWEGAAAIAPGGDLPGGGYSIATNSFPVNSVVDIKNLENDKVVRVKVVSGLNSIGLMATLSRDAADAIGVHGDSSCRVLMSGVSHEIAPAARLTLGPVIEANTDPFAGLTDFVSDGEDAEDFLLPDGLLVDTPKASDTLAEAQPVETSPVETSPETTQPEVTQLEEQPEAVQIVQAPASLPVSPSPPEETPAVVQNPTGIISLAPSEERVPTPVNRPIPREYLAPPIRAYVPPASFSPFQAPLINNFEKGKSYVQIGAYARPDNVEDEITRAGKEYPVAIQNIGTDAKPLFRVLLGPLNKNESTAVLQRAKNQGYKDAFVWHN